MRDCISYKEIETLMKKARLLGNIDLAYTRIESLAREFKELSEESLKDDNYVVTINNLRDGMLEFIVTNMNHGKLTKYNYSRDFKIADSRRVRMYANMYRNRVTRALENKSDLTYDNYVSTIIAECSGEFEIMRNDGKFYTSWKLVNEVGDGCYIPRDVKDIIAGLERVKELATDELICNKRRKSIRKDIECYGMSMILNRNNR